MPITSNPTRIGSGLSVVTTGDLALLSPDNLTIGTGVYVTDDDKFYTLTTSTEALGPGVVEVLGTVGARWIENGGSTGFVTFADLADTTVDSGATLIGVNSNDGMFSEPDLQGVLQEDVVLKTVLAATDGTGGASLVGIRDVGSYFTSTVVEGALQELGAAAASEVTLAALAATTIPSGASLSGVHDTGNYYTATNLETVTQEIGATDATQTANIATNTSNIASNTSAIALRATISNLASTSIGLGASTIGINDAGGIITATTVEGALQELATIIAALGSTYLTKANPTFTGVMQSTSRGDATAPVYGFAGTGGQYGFYFPAGNYVGVGRAGVEIAKFDSGKIVIQDNGSTSTTIQLGADTALSRTAGGAGQFDNGQGLVVGNGLSAWGHALPGSQPSVGANLTNNVSVGGTTAVIDNIVAAGVDTTAASLVSTRNAIYQLTLRLDAMDLSIKGTGITKV